MFTHECSSRHRSAYAAILLLFMAAMSESSVEENPDAQGSFLQSPKPVNAILGSTASFQCVISHGTPFWRINNNDARTFANSGVVPSLPYELEEGGKLVNLTIPATEKFNCSLIECGFFIGEGRGGLSEPVTLKVQGFLAAPPNLTITCKNKDQEAGLDVVITWNAPFSLNLTGVELDISGYKVYINSINTNRSIAVFETQYTRSNFEFQGAIEYEVIVSALNVLGEGNKTYPTQFGIQNCSTTGKHPHSAQGPTSSPMIKPEGSDKSGDETNTLIIYIAVSLGIGVTLLTTVALIASTVAYAKRTQRKGNFRDITLERNEAYGNTTSIKAFKYYEE